MLDVFHMGMEIDNLSFGVHFEESNFKSIMKLTNSRNTIPAYSNPK